VILRPGLRSGAVALAARTGERGADRRPGRKAERSDGERKLTTEPRWGEPSLAVFRGAGSRGAPKPASLGELVSGWQTGAELRLVSARWGIANSVALWSNPTMFNLFKKREDRARTDIPLALIASTQEAATSFRGMLERADLAGRFDPKAGLVEVFAFHIQTVIGATARGCGFKSQGRQFKSRQEAFQYGSSLLRNALPGFWGHMRSKNMPNVDIFTLLATPETFGIAERYFTGKHGIRPEEVLDFGRTYYPTIMNVEDPTMPTFAYFVKMMRIGGVWSLQGLQGIERIALVSALIGTLLPPIVDLDTKVEKLAPKG